MALSTTDALLAVTVPLSARGVCWEKCHHAAKPVFVRDQGLLTLAQNMLGILSHSVQGLVDATVREGRGGRYLPLELSDSRTSSLQITMYTPLTRSEEWMAVWEAPLC